jgi:hypothetical protein
MDFLSVHTWTITAPVVPIVIAGDFEGPFYDFIGEVSFVYLKANAFF